MTNEASKPRARDGALWAITSYFNPMGYRRRRANFRIFRERLDLPLVAVELGYGDQFELGDGDAEILLRRRGTDVLWQKERLLNLAVDALPPTCTKIVWIDCDVFFENRDWHSPLERLLDDVPMAQPYSRVSYVARDWTPGAGSDRIAFTRPSRAWAIAAGRSPPAAFDHEGEDRRYTSAAGFVWAARRELLARHGFYDASIIGGGDRLMACAAYAYLEGGARVHRDASPRKRHFLRWAEPFADDVAGKVGCLDETIFNLWHGDMGDRRIDERHVTLNQHGFDPAADIAIDDAGAWRWNTEKPALHAYVRDYFAGRREDG